VTDGSLRTRIAIPLHNSEPWFASILENVHRLAGHAAITISDATQVDDTFDRLRSELAEMPGITWLPRRALNPGWVPHCNDLLSRSNEEYFAWLPHDDCIGADWVTKAEFELDRHPRATLALGAIEPVVEPGVTMTGHSIEPFAQFGESEQEERVRRALEVCLLGDTIVLGAAFRGVLRRASAIPLPATTGDGEWADILWAIRMLVRGPFAATDAVYRKRWHPNGAHLAWGDLRDRAELRSRWLPEALGDLDDATRERTIAATWNVESARLRAGIHLERFGAEAALRSDFETSRSWRWTRPLRIATSALRRRRSP
jgi:hypothetical protein